MKIDNKEPGVLANTIITDVLMKGSAKDGSNNLWRKHASSYHLVKGMSHLSLHLKEKVDGRFDSGENHLYKAITRLAMALSIENNG